MKQEGAKYMVVTMNGQHIYGPKPLDACKKYLAAARARGSEPGFLRIAPAAP